MEVLSMLKLLLKKNEYKQLLIMEALLKNQEINKSALESDHHITLSTLNRYIRNINAELIELDSNQSIIINATSEKIFLSDAPTPFTHTLFHKIVMNYFHDSTTYQTINALLLQNIQETDVLIESLNISQSYFNKIIKQINNYFCSTNVRICQKRKKIYLVGQEINIVYFEFLVRQFLSKIGILDYQDIPPLSGKNTVIQVYNTLNLNDIHLNRINELHHVLKKRSSTLNTIKITDPELIASLTIMLLESDIFIAASDEYSLSLDVRLFVSLLIRLNSAHLENNEIKNKIGLLLAESETKLAKDAKCLVDDLISNFISPMSVNTYDYYEFIYSAHLHLIYIRLFGTDFKTLFKLTDKESLYSKTNTQPIYLALKNYFEMPNNFSHLTFQSQLSVLSNKNLFIDSTYSAIRRYRSTTVSISFDFIYNLSFEEFLRTSLRQIFSEDVLIFTFNSYDADIITTDYIHNLSEHFELFTFTDTNSLTELENLMALIIRVYTKLIAEFETY